MMTVQEIEAASEQSRPLDFSPHPLNAPMLPLRRTFYPYGFPSEVRTNEPRILDLFQASFGVFERRFDTQTISVEVHLIESDSTECPPSPSYRLSYPYLFVVADSSNYSVIDLSSLRSHMVVSTAALRYPTYLRYFFLEGGAACHVTTSFTTPVHAGCVAFNGQGVLLCGDSGAGKSSLSYACARSGWNYISDDASFLLNRNNKRIVIGDCHKVRFRPSAVELFPEIAGHEITPRAEGKPSIELPTAPMAHIHRRESASIDYLVFLNRHHDGPSALIPYSKEVARHYMRQVPFGSSESIAVQYVSIESLLTAPVFELRYSDLDWAVERLEQLVREGK
ncbi:MAG TPA: aldolase [Acidobacteriaceae bacterium]|jgi:hypothetical protein|nr:aldolase [Acidobacteriaceae bacterium]